MSFTNLSPPTKEKCGQLGIVGLECGSSVELMVTQGLGPSGFPDPPPPANFGLPPFWRVHAGGSEGAKGNGCCLVLRAVKGRIGTKGELSLR